MYIHVHKHDEARRGNYIFCKCVKTRRGIINYHATVKKTHCTNCIYVRVYGKTHRKFDIGFANVSIQIAKTTLLFATVSKHAAELITFREYVKTRHTSGIGVANVSNYIGNLNLCSQICQNI